jgi:adenylate kinase
MSSFVFSVVVICLLFLPFVSVAVAKQVKKKEMNSKVINIVLVGAAGSGKGTQGDLVKDRLNLLKMSAGDVLREYRKNPNNKHTKLINSLIDNGKLVPSEVVNEIIGDYITKNVFKNPGKYRGVLYDGYPRQVAQLEFLDKFLSKHNNAIDLVIFIDVPVDALVDRLSGRFSCSKCGEIYHKTSKKPHVEGVCDKCGHTHFTTRADDADTDAIRQRFALFETETKPVLENYSSRGVVFRVDGTKKPEEIAAEITKKLETIAK